MKYTTLASQNEVIGEIAVEDGKDADSVLLVAKEDVNVIVPAALDKSAVIVEMVDKPEYIEAPVAKGQEVCKANIIYGDEVIATIDLVAANDVELSTFLKVINAVKSFFGSTVVKIILVVIVLLAVIYVYLLVSNNMRKKKRRMQKAQRAQMRDDNPDDFLPPPQRRE